MTAALMMRDSLNAFCEHNNFVFAGKGGGSLSDLRLAIKDVFDIAGHRTGNGHPLWLKTHPPAPRTASSVQKLLDAGAQVVGKTHVDELAYSLNGENFYYGTPVNPRAPGRIPGGSSSGSASATAGGLADIALGTDCGGSVRLPASYCGIFGIRTSHGLVPTDGIVPLAPSFDTVGWFTRDAKTLWRAGEVVLPPAPPFQIKRLLIAADAFAPMERAVINALSDGVSGLKVRLPSVTDIAVYKDGPATLSGLFRILQGDEIRINHSKWIDQYQPEFGPGIRERFEWTRTIVPAEVTVAKQKRQEVMRYMEGLLGDDAILCLPTAPGIAPLLNTPAKDLDEFRARALSLLAIAGLAGLPQVNLPLAVFENCPIGVSVIAPRGCDRGLLQWIAASELQLR